MRTRQGPWRQRTFLIVLSVLASVALSALIAWEPLFAQTNTPAPPGGIVLQPQPPKEQALFVAERPAEPYVPDQLIVKFRAPEGITALARDSITSAFAATRATLFPEYSVVTIKPGEDREALIARLREHPAVELVEPNYYLYATFAPNDPLYPYQWHLEQIRTEQAWDISAGQGVVVAVIDSGVAYETYDVYVQAPDLANTAFVPGWDFVNNDAHPNDDHGHGTHVAGTIAQSTNNGIGVAGVAPGASIMPIKVLDENGYGPTSIVADGIRWAVDHGAQVINLSLGGENSNELLEDAVNYAYNNGVLVVAASGNENRSTVSYPAAYPNALAVGAVRYDESRSYYSNYGAALDVVAPGGDVTVDQNEDQYPDGVLQQTICNPEYDLECTETDPTRFGYYFFQGTSMAAPHVAGVAALLIESGVATTPDEIRQALQETAKDKGAPGWDMLYGHGLVQAYDALLYTAATPTGTATNTPTSSPTGTVVATPSSTPTASPTRTATASPTTVPPPSVYRTYLPFVRNADRAPTPTPTRTPTPQGCNGYIQALTNPSFETGVAPWATLGSPYRTSLRAIDGAYSMRLGADDAIAQTVMVPTWSETAAIYFADYMVSADSSVTAYDYLGVGVFDQADNLIASGFIPNNDTRDSWILFRLPVSNIAAYRGQPMSVMFAGFNDSLYPTTWYVDNVWFVFACGSTTASLGAGSMAELEAAASLPPGIDEGADDRLREIWQSMKP